MGCVSSTFLEEEEASVAGSGFAHHIVSLTSTTYGLLTTLDQPTPNPPPQSPSPPPPPPPPPPPALAVHSFKRLPLRPKSEPEVINSWEVMEGLDFSTTKNPILRVLKPFDAKEINSAVGGFDRSPIFSPRLSYSVLRPPISGLPRRQDGDQYTLEMFEKRCPPGGENSVVIYTTTLHGIRKTFEDCNAVRSAVQGLGFSVKERDVSMDLGFREELKRLMKGTGEGFSVPRLFVRGRYIGGAEQVLRIHEDGGLLKLLEGMPRGRVGEACDGCGGVRFLPCFRCCGGRKVVVRVVVSEGREMGMVVRCPECNENGLVLCPICC